jgi:hypothetical protein
VRYGVIILRKRMGEYAGGNICGETMEDHEIPH